LKEKRKIGKILHKSFTSIYCTKKVDVHGSVHRNINLIERTKKTQPCSRIYYSSVS